MALQAEDAVNQVLEHTRARMADLAKLAILQQRLISDLTQNLSQHCQDAATLSTFEAGFDQYAQGLRALALLRRPVEESPDASSPVQLF